MTNSQSIETKPGLINTINMLTVDGDFMYLPWFFETGKTGFILSEFEYSVN